MRAYQVEIEIAGDWDNEIATVVVTGAPSGEEAERAAMEHAEMMGWEPDTISSTSETSQIPADAIRYAGR